MEDRTAVINIGGKDYQMVLTTKATKEIATRYGGLEHLGDKLLREENFEMAIGEIVWLITLLCNQGVLIHNYQHPEEKQALLTEDEVEILTTPLELSSYKDAIMETMVKGTKRNIESEDSGKNMPAE